MWRPLEWYPFYCQIQSCQPFRFCLRNYDFRCIIHDTQPQNSPRNLFFFNCWKRGLADRSHLIAFPVKMGGAVRPRRTTLTLGIAYGVLHFSLSQCWQLCRSPDIVMGILIFTMLFYQHLHNFFCQILLLWTIVDVKPCRVWYMNKHYF